MNTIKKKYQSIYFGTSLDLSENQLAKLVELFNQVPGFSDSILGGRGSICITDIEGIGPVAVKHYFRGGVIRHFNKQLYVKCGKTRSQIEYEILKRAGDIGIRVPAPLVYAYKGFPLYKAWLVTRKIEARQTLVQLSTSDLNHACKVMKNVIEQLSLLIHHKILHVDLHPGNVVIDTTGNAYLVDFDKAHMYGGPKKKLVHRYVSRWKRAVVKYKLPEILVEFMESKLKYTIY